MRVFDTQRKALWEMGSAEVAFPVKMGPNKRVLKCIKQQHISKVKLVGRRGSGDGLVTLLIQDSSKKDILKKTIRLSKKTASELSFPCELFSDLFYISFEKKPGTVGTVCLDRLILESDESVKRSLGVSRDLVDYRSITSSIMQKRNIAIIVPYQMYGGAEVYIERLIKEGHNKFNISVLFIKNNPMIKTLEGSNVDAIRLGGLAGLKSHLRGSRYDSVIFYNSKQVYEALVSKKKDNSFTSDIVEVYHSKFIWSDAVASMKGRDFVSKIIRVSDSLCKDIVGVDEKDIFTIPVSIDTDKFKREAYLQDLIKANDFKKIIGTVSRVSSEKNLGYVLELAKRIPEFKFVIVGDGPLKDSLERKCKTEGLQNVEFIGHKDNIEHYYATFDGFLLPSNIEGTPISVVEAMAVGMPIFVTPVGEIPFNYSNINGVEFLSKSVCDDAKMISEYDYDKFDDSEMKDYIYYNNDIIKNREKFFSVLSTNTSLARPSADTHVVEGEYI